MLLPSVRCSFCIDDVRYTFDVIRLRTLIGLLTYLLALVSLLLDDGVEMTDADSDVETTSSECGPLDQAWDTYQVTYRRERKSAENYNKRLNKITFLKLQSASC